MNSLETSSLRSVVTSQSVESLSSSSHVYLLHDPCDLRKPHSETLENLGHVHSLDKQTIRGYRTFNTVGINDQQASLRLIDSVLYSTGDQHFVRSQELEAFFSGKLDSSEQTDLQERSHEIHHSILAGKAYTTSNLFRASIQASSQALKGSNPSLILTHVLDREFDENDMFHWIHEELDDEFVVRMKLSRNSNQLSSENSEKPTFLKLKDVAFTHQHHQLFSKIRIRSKVYSQVKCWIEWDSLTLDGREYSVCRIQLFDRKKKSIFKEPMLLISNRPCRHFQDAQAIYRIYLKRSKIEGVFKFLKQTLGWEDFQIRDYQSIQNLVAFCYFVGAYFYELQEVLIQEDCVKFLCNLGHSKGKVSRHFLMEGLKKLLIQQSVQFFLKQQKIPPDLLEQMKSLAGIQEAL